MGYYDGEKAVAADEDDRERGLVGALGTVHDRVNKLEDVVGQLKEKLGPVLLGQRPTAVAETLRGGMIAEDQGPLQSELHKRTVALEGRVRVLVHTVGDLIERIDL